MSYLLWVLLHPDRWLRCNPKIVLAVFAAWVIVLVLITLLFKP